HVVPVMTADAERFIGRTTLSALCSEAVQTSLWDEDSPIPHTRLGQRADAIVVVPATARLIGAYAAGLSTDLLTNTLLATRAPVIVCPAMHTEMWEHPAVQDNLDLLRQRGVIIVEPEEGRLAGGDIGTGRLAAAERVIAAVEAVFVAPDLAGLRVLVTAGGTREPIDAVRVIANRSSGKQGYAIAAEAISRGAVVTLVSTVELATPYAVELIRVETAAEMQAVVDAAAPLADVVVMAAAVADFRPKAPADGKLKKEHGTPEIVLEPTPDILFGLGRRKPPGQVLVGFAAETADLIANAEAKLHRKNLDLMVANDVGAAAVGFQHDTNAVCLIRPESRIVTIGLTDKRSIARAVLDCVVEIRSQRRELPPPISQSDPEQYGATQ
ncbi:MAG: bifunctional phosphopantothenoylcysteine decarboxylase/phosphopantothenate--cysteine ligase CoaBC, partial [Ilumatobacteraceae bacterium]